MISKMTKSGGTSGDRDQGSTYKSGWKWKEKTETSCEWNVKEAHENNAGVLQNRWS